MRKIELERANIIEKVTSQFGEVEVIDSFFKGCRYEGKPLYFLSKALELLSTADIAYFAEGWDKYRGCKIEHTCAVEYGIEVIHYND